jgi:hypothetical protein
MTWETEKSIIAFGLGIIVCIGLYRQFQANSKRDKRVGESKTYKRFFNK